MCMQYRLYFLNPIPVNDLIDKTAPLVLPTILLKDYFIRTILIFYKKPQKITFKNLPNRENIK